MKKIVLAGGTGFLGDCILRYFDPDEYQFVILSRTNQEDHDHVQYVKWDGKSFGPWCEVLEEAEALINLTGKSVDCRYTAQNKQLIYDSRLDSTYVLGEAINLCKCPPKVWINAGSATIYRHATDRSMDELTGELGNNFSEDVCKKWEAAFYQIPTPATRKVLLRIGIVFGNGGGALQPILRLAKLGFGGSQGDGTQYVSWLHAFDFARIVDLAIQNRGVEGTFNATSPYPITNKTFMRQVRKVYGFPFGLPIKQWMLEIGARIIGTETELVLKSRRVVPYKLLSSGFEFCFQKIDEALSDLKEDKKTKIDYFILSNC